MLSILLFILLLIYFLFLAINTIYMNFLMVIFFLKSEIDQGSDQPLNKFIIIIPAHNEELLIGNLLDSLSSINYDNSKKSIVVIADNCSDNTVDVCVKYDVNVMIRLDTKNKGKGHAISWAINNLNINEFNAILIIDADNYVDSDILSELNKHINRGENAIQCYNAVGNREDSWFTQLLYVSRVISNNLYHESKYRIGLSSYLMGNGLCFSSNLLSNKGWTAFSTGEDWEYYAQLIEDNIKISFAAKAKVYHQESRSLNQATSQRLRWSSGRFEIAKTLGIRLIKKGFAEKNWTIIDAAFPLIFPNYSLLINLTIFGMIISLFSPKQYSVFFSFSFLILLIFEGLIFVVGAFVAGNLYSVLKAIFFAPLFLIWKSVIDLLCFSGFYKSKKWIRTKRHVNKINKK